MTLTNLLTPTYRQMLRTLSGLLDKAQQQMPERAETMMSARLAENMLPLSSQIRFAAFQAQEAVFRLRGIPVPAWLDAVVAEGHSAGNTPGSIADARTRIDQALSLLEDVSDNALDNDTGLPISLKLPGDITFDMTGEQYARDWALPQFYFHIITAYAILRNQGIDIGKADYVPHMFGYLRPGSMPGS
ncbi:DUF1993 domain-containing protein [Salinicola corii]|uniref:DUF1993 domain-containing protein n=1 Tax=Salinicola corii TaxID=2606937 RepID=A0A640WEW7_9GAMM|nr:DUF1993 domain-containing protein [Salinicola corii]KAA0018705.1 DUF1993 domain-containing protein [Salinicola corii]